jgi:AcrR family transcriptional regulator/DNA-binding MarR family transcriptional regulator
VSSGHHNRLKRELVIEVQRTRILAGMVEVATERGAGNVTVGDVVARSGVSRRTFYEVFTDGEDCLLAAMEESLARARSLVREAYDPDESWRARIRSALQALLGFFEEEPNRARLLVLESLGAGPVVMERRSQALAELIAAVEAGSREAGKGGGVTPLTAEGIVGGTLATVHARLLQDSDRSLIELTNPLMSMIVLPYLGAAAARKELDLPSPSRRRPTQSSNGATNLNALPMRITYRTMRVLSAVAAQPRASNRQIGESAGITDQGQISKLLQRLGRLGLIVNRSSGEVRGMPNAWTLTRAGAEVEHAMTRSQNTER